MSTLICVPTEMEFGKVRSILQTQSADWLKSCPIEVCGFGPIAAAARSMQLIAERKPGRVILIGIAGVYPNNANAKIGTATYFNRVVCDGVGIGSGSQFIAADPLGWPQFSCNDLGMTIGDIIECQNPTSHPAVDHDLLTVCSASDGPAAALNRQQRYSTVIGEDMEAYGVGLACRLARVDFQLIRGFSNQAGDREKSNWDIDGALRSAVEVLQTFV